MMGEPDTRLFDEHVLVDQARHGDQSAFEELYHRLAPATWRLALAVSRDPAVAAGAVASSFASTLASEPSTPTALPIRAQLFSAVRHAAFDPALQTVAVGVQDTPAPSVAGEAFASLPERWRSALWVVAAEQLPADEAGPALGVPAAAVAPLVTRAHAGFAEKVASVYAETVDNDACRHAADRLVDYASGRLAARESAKVRRHLDGCTPCQDLLTALDDLTPSLGHLALPLPLVLFGISESRWRAALVRRPGPLGLTLPNGQPLPPWAERTVAGAAAVIIALGISSAVLIAGRGSKVRDDGLARSVAAGAPDGESALGGSVGLEGPARVSPTVIDHAAGSIPSARSLDPVLSIPAPIIGGPVTITPAPVAPPTAPPTPPTSPAQEPVLEVTVAVEDVLGLTVGDQCTGVDLAGTVLGCTPTTTGAPVEIITGGSLLDSLGL